MKSFDIEERVNQAVHNFESGYNCAQSVFPRLFGCLRVGFRAGEKDVCIFGGGVGRMREVCGTVNAMAMLAGFKYPVFDPLDQEACPQLWHGTKNGGFIQGETWDDHLP